VIENIEYYQMLQLTHLVNTLHPEWHLWECVWLYKKVCGGRGHSLAFLLRQTHSQRRTSRCPTD